MHTRYSLGDRNTHSIFHPRRFTECLVPLLALTAIVLMPFASAQAANCHWYNVTLTGTAAWVGIQSAGFQNVPQYAMWRDTGIHSAHQVEFALLPYQDLNISAQVGNIEFATNSSLAYYASLGARGLARDLATVSVGSNGVVSFHLTGDTYPPVNTFVAPGNPNAALGGIGFDPTGALSNLLSLGGPALSVTYFDPTSGDGYFYLLESGRTIAGALNNLRGLSVSDFNPNVQGFYQAQFFGTYLGSVQCN